VLSKQTVILLRDITLLYCYMEENLMKSVKYIILLATVAFFMSACSSQPLSGRETGALTGGALGTGLGAIVGNQVGSTGAGMAIGGGAGALTGALIGNQSDNVRHRQTEQDERLRRQDEELMRQRRELDELRRQRGDDYRRNDPYRGY